MANSLRADTTAIASAASVFAQLGGDITASRPGQHLDVVTTALPGSRIAAAAAAATARLNAATDAVGGQWQSLSSKLTDAAHRYDRTDEETGDDIAKLVDDEKQDDDGPGTEKDIADWTDAWMKNTREVEAHNARPLPSPNDPAAVSAYNQEAARLNAEKAKLWVEAGEIFSTEAERREHTGGWVPPLVPGGPLYAPKEDHGPL